MEGIIRVLIVDDSAFIRKVVRAMLSRSAFIEVVGAARDGEEAMEMVEQLRPNVVTLDLNMPRLNGVDFLRHQMVRRPIPVVLLSIASKSGSEVIRALEAGAVDVVQKPTALANDQVLDIAQDLIAKVKAAARAHVRVPPKAVASQPLHFSSRRLRTNVLVIGASTGGPQALRQLIPLLPGNFPIPIALVLHMPVGFTDLFAKSLNDISPLTVMEAKGGEEVRQGVVLVAPAGYHLTYRREPDDSVKSSISLLPLETPHRPAVDVLFQSAADVYGEQVLAVVLTGMGADGMQGSAWVKANGGRVLTESEDTCVVYGMPRSVVEAGLSDASVPLPNMARTIIEVL